MIGINPIFEWFGCHNCQNLISAVRRTHQEKIKDKLEDFFQVMIVKIFNLANVLTKYFMGILISIFWLTSRSIGHNTPWPILPGVFPVILHGHGIYINITQLPHILFLYVTGVTSENYPKILPQMMYQRLRKTMKVLSSINMLMQMCQPMKQLLLKIITIYNGLYEQLIDWLLISKFY